MRTPRPATVTVTDDGVSADTRAPVYLPGPHTTPHGTIEVTNRDFAVAVLEHTPRARAHLYRRGNNVGRLRGEEGNKHFELLGENGARNLFDDYVCPTISRRSKDDPDVIETKAVPFSKDMAGLVLDEAMSSPLVPELKAVVNHPVFVTGWKLAEPGFNREAGIYYDEPEHLRGIASDAPGTIEALDDLLDGFPFKDEASRESALALMLTLLVRAALDGNVPGFLIRAHAERTGKTYLARTCVVAVRGDEPPMMQIGAKEEEVEKRLSSAIMAAKPVLVIDNVPAGESLDSPSFAMLLTSRRWTGRVLGTHALPDLPNDCTVILTGNNVNASGEIAKRLVPIHLEAKDARPQDRVDFPHPDPVAYARAHQRRTLAAMIGMVRAWDAAGRPEFRRVAFGGYESWVRVVGGILTTAGSTAFLGQLRTWQDAADEFGAEASALLEDWYASTMHDPALPESPPCRGKDLIERATRLDIMARYRQGNTEAARSAMFGKRCTAVLVDRPFRIRAGEPPKRADELDLREEIEVRVRKTSSGTASLYRLERVR